MSESGRQDGRSWPGFEVRGPFVRVGQDVSRQDERIRILVEFLQPRNAEQEGTYQMPFLFFNAELLLYGAMATAPVVMSSWSLLLPRSCGV